MQTTQTGPLVNHCPKFQAAVELIGRRWTGAIILSMMAGADRFHEIRETIPGLSDRLLSTRLRELESERIVTRSVLPDVPPAVRYDLTDKGKALAPVLDALQTWSRQHMPSTTT